MNIKAKFILTYVAGIVTGIVLLFVVVFLWQSHKQRLHQMMM